VKPERRGVVGIDAGDHDVLAARCGTVDQRPYESRADATPALIGSNMDAVFDGEAVTGPRAKVTERGVPEHRRVIGGEEHRVALRDARPEPGLVLGQRHRFVAVDGGRRRHDVVVDREHLWQVVFDGITNVHGSPRSSHLL
jgi:hypothetical protein